MEKLVIFGGTFEGHKLAEWAAGAGFSVTVCVATEYGRKTMTPGESVAVLQGRMDEEEMVSFLSDCRPAAVVDATHPYAVEVSKSVKAAAERLSLPCLRVIRAGEELPFTSQGDVITVSSAAEAASLLRENEEKVLLTTGSKELTYFSSLQNFSDRFFARVLPDREAIAACERAGLSGKHIIAMQGPFSTEMNLALIHEVGAGWLITKESGKEGGFPEKAEAALKSKIRMIVIRRPADEEGLTLSQVKERLAAFADAKSAPAIKGEKSAYSSCRLTLIGMGMGGMGQLTLEALSSLCQAGAVFGSGRLIGDIAPLNLAVPEVSLYRGEEVLSWLSAHPEVRSACVLFSGDTGFYSGCADFLTVFGTGENRLRVLPGISSFSCLCARFGLRQELFFPASAHGRKEDVVKLLKNHGRVFLLLDPETTVGLVCRTLTEAGYGGAKIYAGSRLGYPDEALKCGRADSFTEEQNDPLAVLAMEREDLSDA